MFIADTHSITMKVSTKEQFSYKDQLLVKKKSSFMTFHSSLEDCNSRDLSNSIIHSKF